MCLIYKCSTINNESYLFKWLCFCAINTQVKGSIDGSKPVFCYALVPNIWHDSEEGNHRYGSTMVGIRNLINFKMSHTLTWGRIHSKSLKGEWLLYFILKYVVRSSESLSKQGKIQQLNPMKLLGALGLLRQKNGCCGILCAATSDFLGDGDFHPLPQIRQSHNGVPWFCSSSWAVVESPYIEDGDSRSHRSGPSFLPCSLSPAWHCDITTRFSTEKKVLVALWSIPSPVEAPSWLGTSWISNSERRNRPGT